MKNKKSIWNTRLAKVFDTAPEFPQFSDPLTWALDICENDPTLKGTAMRWVFEGSDDADQNMVYASRGGASPAVRKALVQGVRDGAAVQLQSTDILRRVPEVRDYVERFLEPELREVYPFGFTMSVDLFVTGAEHVYNAHCDLGDGILIQLHDQKNVDVWGPIPSFFDEILFNHNFRDEPHRFDTPREKLSLFPGKTLYFPRGMMHEISVPENSQSVSVAIRPETIYPVVTLIEEISEMMDQPDAYTVKENFAHWDKFRATAFDPTSFSDFIDSDRMPPRLSDSIRAVVDAKNASLQNELTVHLNEWWRLYCKRRTHSRTSCLPRPPKNKEEILKAWEDERISKSAKSNK